MSYKVIHFFTDAQDCRHPYKVGDIFPRQGLSVSDARLKELSSSSNRQGKPLIELVEDKVEMQDVAEVKNVGYTKTEINRMPLDELKALATEKGIDGANDMTGGELKKLLIEMFDL